MKGYKQFGKGGGTKGHGYPSHFGFSGSAGHVAVKPHMRGAPKFARGGMHCSEDEMGETHGAKPMMAKGGHWIQKAVKHPGALHRELGVPAGQKIPAAKIAKAAHSSNPTLARRANLAKTLGKMHKARGGHVSAGDEGHAAVHRDEPVTEVDKDYGGKTPLLPGFKKGGLAQMKAVAKGEVNRHVATPPPRGHGVKSVGSFGSGPRFGK